VDVLASKQYASQPIDGAVADVMLVDRDARMRAAVCEPDRAKRAWERHLARAKRLNGD